MKFTLSWLKTHLETDRSLDDLAAGLTNLGLEVEGIEDRAAQYAPFRVAYVEKAEKHPDADRLKVCVVDTGGGKIQVVCGAPNARTGMKGVFAPEGSFIPGTQSVLKKGVIRGQESCGMLVSEKEMGISDNHEGIIEVPADTPLGTPFAALFGFDDPIIEIKLTPNRADCAGVRGIARDLAAGGFGTLKPIDTTPVKGTFKSSVDVSLKFEDQTKDACSLFVGRMIRGVKNGPSPDWLQRRLKSIGLRPISALVDITNFMTIDLNRPLHVFDADKLNGNIHVRLAKQGETLAALNDKTYALTPTMTAVCDDTGVLALGGIIGGALTGCSDDTVNVFLEAAYFDPMRTAHTGRALSCESDARYRFERGIDPEFTRDGAEIATRLILEICDGEAGEIVTTGAGPRWQRTITFNSERTKSLGGLTLPEKDQKDILTALGFTIEEKSNTWNVTPPSWRGDVEGPADLVEEIVRVAGYDKIPAQSVRSETAVPQPAETVSMQNARRARTALGARGMNESITWSFMHHHHAAVFGGTDTALRLSNPISADLDQMRPSILPNLLQAAQRNADRGYGNAALFEVGAAFATAKASGQKWIAAGVRHVAAGPRHWSGAHASHMVDAFDAKADALAALSACGAPVARLQTTREAPAWYHPGRSGALKLGNVVLAYFGEIHPATLEALDVKGPVAAFEIDLNALPPAKKKSGMRPPLTLSPFQPIARDFAFIVDDAVEGDTLIKLVKGADKNLITDVSIFDVYKGKGVEAGKKSIALSVTLQPTGKTLTDPEIEKVCKTIIDTVVSKTGASLRA